MKCLLMLVLLIMSYACSAMEIPDNENEENTEQAHPARPDTPRVAPNRPSLHSLEPELDENNEHVQEVLLGLFEGNPGSTQQGIAHPTANTPNSDVQEFSYDYAKAFYGTPDVDGTDEDMIALAIQLSLEQQNSSQK